MPSCILCHILTRYKWWPLPTCLLEITYFLLVNQTKGFVLLQKICNMDYIFYFDCNLYLCVYQVFSRQYPQYSWHWADWWLWSSSRIVCIMSNCDFCDGACYGYQDVYLVFNTFCDLFFDYFGMFTIFLDWKLCWY